MLVAAADAARRAWLRAALRVPFARAVYLQPSPRLGAAQVAAVTTALALAVIAPGLSLTLGAALFGVPHVVAGVRHLAVRRALGRPALAALALAVLFGAGAYFDGRPLWLRLLTACFAAAVGAELIASGLRAPLKLVALTALAAAAGLAMRQQALFLVAVTHLHAMGSVVFFCAAARARGFRWWPLAALCLVALALLMSGAADALIAREAWLGVRGPDEVLRRLGEPLAALGQQHVARALVVYAFGQSLHYAVWLRLMPEIDRPVPVPWSFRLALVALQRDLGRATWPALGLCAVATAGMLAGGAPARELYFALVYFHIGLEAAALVRAVTPWPSPSPAR